MADEDLLTDLDPQTDPQSDPADGPVEPPDHDSEAPGPSLRDTLKAAFKADRQEPTAEVIAAENAAGRKYDKSTGRFIADPAAAPKPAAARTAQEFAAVQTGAKPADGAPSTAPAGPPTSWSAEAKAAFASLPPAVQQAVSRREQEVSQGFQQYQGLKQRADAYEGVISPYRQMFGGVADHEALNNILSWFGEITRDPSRGIPELAEFIGFDLSTVSNAAADPAQATTADPRIMAELSTLRGEVGQFKTWQEQQRHAELNRVLTDWSKGKEHYAAVKVDMGRLMQAGIVPMGDLDAAYGKAMALHGLSAAPAATPITVDPAARVRNARHAAVSPRVASPNGATPNQKPKSSGSVRDDLRGAIAQLSS